MVAVREKKRFGHVFLVSSSLAPSPADSNGGKSKYIQNFSTQIGFKCLDGFAGLCPCLLSRNSILVSSVLTHTALKPCVGALLRFTWLVASKWRTLVFPAPSKPRTKICFLGDLSYNAESRKTNENGRQQKGRNRNLGAKIQKCQTTNKAMELSPSESKHGIFENKESDGREHLSC